MRSRISRGKARKVMVLAPSAMVKRVVGWMKEVRGARFYRQDFILHSSIIDSNSTMNVIEKIKAR